MKVSRCSGEVAALFVVVAIALFVRFHAITTPAVWYDEAYSLLLAERSPADIWSTTARDVHPPLYYVLLHYWMLMFGNGVLAARSQSALADVGTLLLSIKLMSLVSTRRATWMAALLFALLPISVRYSQEIRMYTLIGFWLMGATVALVCWVNSPQQKRFAVIYVLLMTAAFYTHYFSALCVLVHWFFWWLSRGLSVRAWIGANAAILFLYLPWLPHFIDQLLQRNGLDWIPPLTWEVALTVVWSFMVMSDEPASLGWRLVPTVLIVAFAIFVVSKDRSKQHYSALLVSYFFVPVLTVFLLSQIFPIFIHRYLLFAAVGLPIIIAVALDGWEWRDRILAPSAFLLVVAVQTYGVMAVYEQSDEISGAAFRREGKLDVLAARIAREARPDDEIVVEGLFWYLPFMYYNTTGIQPKMYVVKSTGVPCDTYGFGGCALVPGRVEGTAFMDFSAMKPKARRVWWVTGQSDPEHSRLFPNDWIHVLTLRGGESEARLFVLDGAPTPHEIVFQPLFTQQLPR
ncbi:glycosyltransferase family 39 protein [Pseudomonas sp. GL-B-19]|uniref:glycosyltransferase family 39 protein n=1 Tax=Pseudomonas sp. GL-B-19 TaxID=2832393 RepID=UPI001CBFAA75|nr:glycosyltransferase family 39 protein [Pseudomonas sp. GL-B-19]